MDEFSLVASESDLAHFGTVRSRFCSIFAATQSILSLADRIGAAPARALINHFNTQVFMRTRELETAAWAYTALGTRKESNLGRLPMISVSSRYGLQQNSERNRSSYLPGRCPGAVIPASGIYFVLGWTTHGAARLVRPSVWAAPDGRGTGRSRTDGSVFFRPTHSRTAASSWFSGMFNPRNSRGRQRVPGPAKGKSAGSSDGIFPIQGGHASQGPDKPAHMLVGGLTRVVVETKKAIMGPSSFLH